MNVRHVKPFAVINRHAKTSPEAMLVFVLLVLCPPTIATAKTSTSVSFTRTVDRAHQMPSASIPSVRIVVTAKLASKTRQPTIENAWMWMSAKSIRDFASTAA